MRTDTPEGFSFLTPPWWFRALHPVEADVKYSRLAFAAYRVWHYPEYLEHPRQLAFATRFYPLAWLYSRLKAAGVWSLVAAILFVPFILGYLAGIARHITIEVR